MGIKKMSLANIQGKLSRVEMKNIMAGSGGRTVVETQMQKFVAARFKNKH